MITSTAAAILAELETLPKRMRAGIAAAVDRENQLTAGAIAKEKLTAAGPKFLNVRSGRLRGSLRAKKAVVTETAVDSGIGSNVKYAGSHEFGFAGTVLVRAHQRKAPQGDKFSIGGAILSRRRASEGRSARSLKKAQVASGVARVKAHSRKMFIPERAPIRTGITERVSRYNASISAAIVAAFNERGQA